MNVHRLAAVVSSAAVIAAVIAGLVMTGMPAEQRMQRLDARRVEDLRHLAVAANAYWQGQGVLPAQVEELVDGRRLSRIPSDPVTGARYPYERLSASRYRLCAQFDQASNPSAARDFWAHPAGSHCFEFEVTREPRPAW